MSLSPPDSLGSLRVLRESLLEVDWDGLFTWLLLKGSLAPLSLTIAVVAKCLHMEFEKEIEISQSTA